MGLDDIIAVAKSNDIDVDIDPGVDGIKPPSLSNASGEPFMGEQAGTKTTDGETIYLWDWEQASQIAGVVANALYSDLKQDPPATVYVPYEQSHWGVRGMNIAVRTAGPPEGFAGVARSLVRDLDPNLPLSDVATQERAIDERLTQERMFAKLSTGFGVLALLLSIRAARR